MLDNRLRRVQTGPHKGGPSEAKALIMTLRALCFDFDGTLVDSEPIHLRTWNEILKPHGVFVTVDEFRHRYVGTVAPEMAAELVKKFHIRADPASLASAKDKKYTAWVRRNPLPMMPYARESVEAFARRRIKLACVTGSPRQIVTLSLKRLGLRKNFRVVVGRNDVQRSKPDPECYLKAVRDLGESADTVISFEDSEAGVMAATGAGLVCYGIAWGSSPAHDLSAATRIFHGLREATRWVTKNYGLDNTGPRS
jgi:HAD superfamily hydrolase (TIGR01509 family)